MLSSTLAHASGHPLITGLAVQPPPPPAHMIEVSLGNALVRPAPCSECERALNEQQKPCKELWIKMLFSHLPLSFQH